MGRAMPKKLAEIPADSWRTADLDEGSPHRNQQAPLWQQRLLIGRRRRKRCWVGILAQEPGPPRASESMPPRIVHDVARIEAHQQPGQVCNILHSRFFGWQMPDSRGVAAHGQVGGWQRGPAPNFRGGSGTRNSCQTMGTVTPASSSSWFGPFNFPHRMQDIKFGIP